MDDKEIDAQAWRSARRVVHGAAGQTETIQETMRRIMWEFKGAMMFARNQSCMRCTREGAAESAARKKAVKPLALGLGE